MKQYILIQRYPGGPKKEGTIVTFMEDLNVYGYPIDNKFIEKGLLSISDVEEYPKNWAPYNPIKLKIPVGSFIYFLHKENPATFKSPFVLPSINTTITFVLWHVGEVVERNGTSSTTLSSISSTEGRQRIINVSIINLAYDTKKLLVFETQEEGMKHLLENIPLLSIKDISTIYSSALNPAYHQEEQLKLLIKSKL